jgi:GNAT superfamily N-acetyltransferase
MSDILIRFATPADAEQVADLSAQLGYSATPEETAARIADLTREKDHAIFIAEISGRPIAWMDIYVQRTLAVGTVTHIAGLVVDELHRSRGIGKLLLQDAEAWARERGCKVVRLTSNLTRSRAHGFYENLGYKVIKTQKAFAKEL